MPTRQPATRVRASPAQKGAALIAILGALAVIGLLAALATSGGGNNTALADGPTRARATGVLQGLEQIVAGYDRAALAGVPAAQVTLDSNPATGLYAPNIGGQLAPSWQPGTFTAGITDPPLTRPLFQLIGVGTDANADRVIVLPNIPSAVCRQINIQHGGLPVNPMGYAFNDTDTVPADGEVVPDWQIGLPTTNNGAMPTAGCIIVGVTPQSTAIYGAYAVVEAR